MKSQNFGVEIELTGITREKAAQVIASYYGTTSSHAGGAYRAWVATDAQGREWKAMRDSSIYPSRNTGTADLDEYRCEVVTPILQYSDIEALQEIVRKLRKAGAIANSSCGIHIHVGAERFNATQLRNLANLVASRETMIAHAIGTSEARLGRWCKFADKRFMERINAEKPSSRDDLKSIWYNGCDGSYDHYDSSRYHLLNLHATWTKGTVEFRCFNSTTHAGEIKAYIQFCLAVVNQAYTQRSASYKPMVTDNEKYSFRCWLLRLGLIGDEFKTARFHLMKRLEGNSAWRHAV